ncbi:ABC transporter related [Desulfofarcimen acetoxidans DSM 771]|uniref:ABC transporter related n=1 Tax=Desulfofarcimen acetoxidans (strain ATCC 49208 / DSM 771 / KCTC 5769 / VKM B-1644 / 5575) TaxID=485916 RepID=C8W6T5_DESAS|nr:ABC transporter ATP-binding protein [Desulfofarcimen acetoxidans]ACV64194.1 ABC transporter related [Desulfofarcimen acetoxidans DSM 771]
MDAVAVKGLAYQYQAGGPSILKCINFKVTQGEMVVVAGLSGCGKSTLCGCISGTVQCNRYGVMKGEVVVNGKNVREMRAAKLALEVGMVFQDPDMQLFSPTVEDEIAFAPENLCLPPDRIRERVDGVLALVGIADLREANPYQLSGGEKHLVALAAVLSLDPPVLILDEVMSQLDAAGKKRVSTVLKKLRDGGKTIIVVEHDLEAVAFADRLLVLENGAAVRFDRMETLLADRDFMAAIRLIC